MPTDPALPSDEEYIEMMCEAAFPDWGKWSPMIQAAAREPMRDAFARIRAPLEARGIEAAWAECRDIPAAEFRLRALARQRAEQGDGA